MSSEKLTNKNYIFLRLFKKWSWYIIILSAFFQGIIFPSTSNFFGISITILGWYLTDKLVLQINLFQKFTLSTLILVGYALTQYYLPLTFTLLEGKPLIYNLKYPDNVFIHSILAFIIMVICHQWYRTFHSLNKPFRNKAQKLLQKLNFFTAPSVLQVWLMGIIGLTSMFVSYFFIKQSYENISEGADNKFIEGFIPFTYAPYFLLLCQLYSPRELRNKKITIILVILFSTLVFAVGIGGNARSLFITGLVATAIGYFVGLILGKFSHKIFTIKSITLAFIVFWFVTGPLSDLGTSMVIARAQRGNISKIQMLDKTLELYKDKQALRFFKLAEGKKIKEWDEHYFDNIFLARFCNLKFNDVGLEQYYKMDGIDSRMFDYSVARFWSVLPQPLLDVLQLNIDKKKILSASIGDQMLHVAGGSNALGTFRTGQFASTGMASFGLGYLLLLGFGLIPLFFLLDLFVIYRQTNDNIYTFISLGGLLPITSFFMFLSLSTTSQSVIFIFTYMLRDWPQLVTLYLLLFFVSKQLSILISGSKR